MMIKWILKVLLLVAWLFAGTVLYAFIFVRYGESLPPLPEFPEKIFPYLFSSHELSAEIYQNIYLFSGSFFYVALFTLIAFACYCIYKPFRE